MSNYQESTVTGSTYLRCKSVIIRNPLNEAKGVGMQEERVYVLDDKVMTEPTETLNEPFNAENALTSVPMLNPETGAALGPSMTYQELYVALYSLYIHLAKRRDAA